MVLNGDVANSRQAKAEFRSALALWFCLCFLISAVVVARAAGAALFLNHYGGRELALVYVFVGLAVVAIIYGLSWITHGVQYDRVAIATVGTLGLGTAILRLLISDSVPSGAPWLFGALYIFLETFALVTTMQVWTLANSLFTASQAKRLYVFIATGGIVGSLLGGLTTRTLQFMPTADLLWIVVGLCPLMIVAIFVFKRQARDLRQLDMKTSPVPDRGRSARTNDAEHTVRWIRHPVLRQRAILRLASRLSLLAFLAACTTNLIDFYFKTYADEHFHGDTAGLAGFFGNFYLMAGCLSLGMQLLVTPVIVRYSSVFVGLALTPLVLTAGTALNLVGATLLRATILKLFDSGFAHSIHRSCTEMLYTPLPPNLTGEIKLISEGVAGRAGLVMSGLVLYLLAPTLTPGTTLWFVSAMIGCWFVALIVLKRTYRTSVTIRETAPTTAKLAA